mgnify:CR=1 FL=1
MLSTKHERDGARSLAGNERLRLLTFSDIDREDGELRPPLGNQFTLGAAKSLLDSLAPLLEFFPQLERQAKIALKKASQLTDCTDITCDNKKGALVLFSMEAEPRQESLYYLLNGALQAPQRDLMHNVVDNLARVGDSWVDSAASMRAAFRSVIV